MSKITTSQRRTAKLILDRWKADLTQMNRSFDSVADNFDDLVSNMYLAEVPFELAEENINAAILEHYPSTQIAKMVWKNAKSKKQTDLDFSAYINEWKEAISKEGKRVFYGRYKLLSDKTVKENTKTSGSMSQKEYRAQRRYAESFPVLDTSKIEVKIKDKIEEMENDFMTAVTGENDE